MIHLSLNFLTSEALKYQEMSKSKSLVIIIDNSSSSINGDFFPNRLDAQKIAAERLSTYLFSVNQQTQIALLTMGSIEFSIRSSFTNLSSKLQEIMKNINPGGVALTEKALKTALLIMNHATKNENEHRILLFIHSYSDIDSDEKVQFFKEKISKANVFLDIVSFSSDSITKDYLKHLCNGEFLDIVNSPHILSDLVLASKIGTGNIKPQISLKALKKTNPELYEATKYSLTFYKQNGEYVDQHNNEIKNQMTRQIKNKRVKRDEK